MVNVSAADQGDNIRRIQEYPKRREENRREEKRREEKRREEKRREEKRREKEGKGRADFDVDKIFCCKQG